MMVRRLRLLVVSAIAVTMALPAAAMPAHAAAAPGTRAMWLWSRAAPAAVVSWATGHGVREIFAYAAWNLPASGDLPRLQDLKARADAAGVKLSALGGDPGWTFDHAAALAWQRAALNTGLFAGTHLDVEPYALAEWNADRAGTVTAFQDLLSALQTDDVRPIEADVPFWYNTIPSGSGTLADQVLSRVDAVTAMTYRDTATGGNSMTDVATDILARGAVAGKPVRLAAETQNLPDCLYCTFYEEGQAQLVNTLSTVDAVEGNQAAFAGIAVHHYDSWVSLRP
jgi:hypothetical protein